MDESLEKLEAYVKKIDVILAVFGTRQRLPVSERDLVRECLRKLKSELDNEYHRLTKVRNMTTLSKVEKAFYAPAIIEVKTAIRVKSNSIPDNEWIGQLYNAKDTIKFYIDGLRKLESK